MSRMNHEQAEAYAARVRAIGKEPWQLVEELMTHGVSQKETASRLGVTPQAVSRWTRDVRPSVENLDALAKLHADVTKKREDLSQEMPQP